MSLIANCPICGKNIHRALLVGHASSCTVAPFQSSFKEVIEICDDLDSTDKTPCLVGSGEPSNEWTDKNKINKNSCGGKDRQEVLLSKNSVLVQSNICEKNGEKEESKVFQSTMFDKNRINRISLCDEDDHHDVQNSITNLNVSYEIVKLNSKSMKHQMSIVTLEPEGYHSGKSYADTCVDLNMKTTTTRNCNKKSYNTNADSCADLNVKTTPTGNNYLPINTKLYDTRKTTTTYRKNRTFNQSIEENDKKQTKAVLLNPCNSKKEENEKLPHSKRKAFGSLRPLLNKDIIGSRKRRKAFDRPPDTFEYLVVLDFEWTCDNTKKMVPCAEITEFSGTLLRLKPRLDIGIVSEFQRYCKPVFNPVLSQFSIDLTAITQDQVDKGLTLTQTLKDFDKWLTVHANLSVYDEGKTMTEVRRTFRKFALVTWSDADLMQTLHHECIHKNIKKPWYCMNWINLKEFYYSHFKRKPRGGLRKCVEQIGIKWEGRAHSGIVDARNTAKIAEKMAIQGHRFHRFTRGCGDDGVPFGLKR